MLRSSSDDGGICTCGRVKTRSMDVEPAARRRPSGGDGAIPKQFSRRVRSSPSLYQSSPSNSELSTSLSVSTIYHHATFLVSYYSSGSALIAAALAHHNIHTVFGLVGIPVIEIGQACIDRGIRFIAFRNEQSAAYVNDSCGVRTSEGLR